MAVEPADKPQPRLSGADLAGRLIVGTLSEENKGLKPLVFDEGDDLTDAELNLAVLQCLDLRSANFTRARLDSALLRDCTLDLDRLGRARPADLLLDRVRLAGAGVEACCATDSRLRLRRPAIGSALATLAWPIALCCGLALLILGQVLYSRAAGHPLTFYSHDNYAAGLSRALALAGNPHVLWHPAWYHLPTGLWVALFGPQLWAINLTPLLYLLLFGLGLYALAAEFFERRAALCAGLFGALTPAAVAFSRVYDDHTLNLALQAWFAWCLARSRLLAWPLWLLPAAGLALLAGQALQERTHLLLCLLGMSGATAYLLLAALRVALRARDAGRPAALRRSAGLRLALSTTLLAAAMLGAAWLAVVTLADPYYFQEAGDVGGAHFVSIAARPLAALGFYPFSLLSMAGPAVGLIGLIGVGLLFKRRSPARWLAALWLLLPLVLLSLIGKKEQPYLVAALPGLVLAAAAAPGLAEPRSRNTAAAAGLLLAAIWIGLCTFSTAQGAALKRIGEALFGGAVIDFVTPPQHKPELNLLERDCAEVAELAQRLDPAAPRVFLLTDDYRFDLPAQFFIQRRLPDGAAFNLGSAQRGRLPQGDELLALVALDPAAAPALNGRVRFLARLQAAPFEPLPDQIWEALLKMDELPLIQAGERWAVYGPLPQVAQ